MTVKSEKPEHPEHDDCDGPPPSKMMALTQNISQNLNQNLSSQNPLTNQNHNQNSLNNQNSLAQNLTSQNLTSHNSLTSQAALSNPLKLQQSTHTSSGASSESGSHRSSSSDSHDVTNLSKINIKTEALGGENSLNLSSLTMHHLLGLTQMSQSSEKDTSGAESDGKVKSMDGLEPDFSKIISDLKANEGEKFGERFGEKLGDSMEGKSSDAIFKDLINSLPL